MKIHPADLRDAPSLVETRCLLWPNEPSEGHRAEAAALPVESALGFEFVDSCVAFRKSLERKAG